MRDLYTEDLSNGRSGVAQKGAPKIRKYKIDKRKFFVSFVLFVALIALGIVGIQSFVFKDSLENKPFAVPAAAKPAVNRKLLIGKVIVVDAGHGGFDPGATGISGEHESDLNLKIASVLQGELKAAGAKVIMTRMDKNAIAPTKDEDMAKRREITQENNPDMFISVHMNMETDSSIKGPILMFQQGSLAGEELAKAITKGINSNVETMAPCKYRSADLIVLRGNTQPSVLVECGFISNQEEEQKLLQDSYQKKFVQAVVFGIESFITGQTTTPSKPKATITQTPTGSTSPNNRSSASVKDTVKPSSSTRTFSDDSSNGFGSRITTNLTTESYKTER